ncbi:MAG: PEP-CTERM sorting domain-containing protein [Leptolyngbya sp. SIO4C1]|nr:PEP-CTERM sorting domain-containing protein [Leptolyngbya sp. SIO4C1]
MKRFTVLTGLAIAATTITPLAAEAAVFKVTASDSYFTFAGNISGTSDIRLLSDKATAIGFEGLDTISFLQFDLSALQTPEIQDNFLQATLKLEYDSVLTEPANLIPATADRPVNVSVYDLTAPFDDVSGNGDDIDFGPDGENAIATATVGDDGVYTWDITTLVDQWLVTATSDTDIALSGVFGNVDIDGRNSYASFYPAGATAGLPPTLVIETVPEPTSIAALVLLGSGLMFSRKRRFQGL